MVRVCSRINHLRLQPTLGMCGALPQFCLMTSWLAKGQLYFLTTTRVLSLFLSPCTDSAVLYHFWKGRHGCWIYMLPGAHSDTALRDPRLPPRLNWIPPSSGLWGVNWFETDVSGLPVCPILKCPSPSFKMGPTCSLETSVWNLPTPRNNPEDGSSVTDRLYVIALYGHPVAMITFHWPEEVLILC